MDSSPNWRVSLPNPKHGRDWAKGVGIRAKTDRQDAFLSPQTALREAGLPGIFTHPLRK